MLLLMMALGCGVAAGYLTHGRLQALERVQLRSSWLLIVAFAAQAALGLAPSSGRMPVLAVSYGLIGVWLLLNGRRRSLVAKVAVAIFAVGWLLNLAAILGSGGMPVSRAALRHVGVTQGLPSESVNITKHVVSTGEEPLASLGDVIPVPPLRTVVSIGDIFMFGSVALAVSRGMRHKPA